MIVGIKDASKLIGISIISCCAVVVCTMFLNFYFDALNIKDLISSEQETIFYNAQVSTAKVVCIVSGGCMLITSVIMLIFYIKYYIDTHNNEIGILKALGYSNIKIAKSFWIFGISIFIGAAVGFTGAFLLMPSFYSMQNEDNILPKISIHFHSYILLCLVILPTVAFSFISILYAYLNLRRPVISLLKDNLHIKTKNKKKMSDGIKDRSFIEDLKINMLSTKKTLVFFIVFASFCFSAMTQMSASMKELSSVMMGAMILIIGIILACTTLFIAITTVIKGNTKTIAMMRVFGYSQKECCRSLLGGYRPLSYIGFALGTVYQYVLLRIMVDVVFKDIDETPVYKFDFSVMIISLLLFIIIYEIIMYCYSEKINKISIKEIMTE